MTTSNAHDAYQEVTDRILAELERGSVPWEQPWRSGGWPRSMATGKRYQGVNVMLLGLTAWPTPWWGTYRQIAELGGQVQRGEHSTGIVFWKELTVPDRSDPDGERTTVIPMARMFRVFNAAQASGLPARFYPDTTAAPEPITEPAAIAQAYLDNGAAAQLLHDAHGRAYYQPASDTIHLPPLAEHKTAATPPCSTS